MTAILLMQISSLLHHISWNSNCNKEKLKLKLKWILCIKNYSSRSGYIRDICKYVAGLFFYSLCTITKRAKQKTFSGTDALDAVTYLNVVVLKWHEPIWRRVTWLRSEDTRVAVLPVEHFVVIRHLSIDLAASNDTAVLLQHSPTYLCKSHKVK